jgi:hypothetical protein
MNEAGSPRLATRHPDNPQAVPWRIPDLDARKFRAEAHLQSLAVATSAWAEDDQNFIDAISDSE